MQTRLRGTSVFSVEANDFPLLRTLAKITCQTFYKQKRYDILRKRGETPKTRHGQWVVHLQTGTRHAIFDAQSKTSSQFSQALIDSCEATHREAGRHCRRMWPDQTLHQNYFSFLTNYHERWHSSPRGRNNKPLEDHNTTSQHLHCWFVR